MTQGTYAEKTRRILEGALVVHDYKTCRHEDQNYDAKWKAWNAWRIENPDLIGDAWAIEAEAFRRAV